MSTLATLAEVVRELPEIEDLDGLRALLAIQDLLSARVAATVARIHRTGEVAADGAVSTKHWLRTFAGRSPQESAQLVRRATRCCSACPPLLEAWRDGRLSTGQVDIVTSHVTDRTEPVLSSHGAELVPALIGLSTKDTEVAMRHWAAAATALVNEPLPPIDDRSLFLSSGLDGGAELQGHLDQAGHLVVAAALAAATEPDEADAPRRTHSERRADALVTVCQFFLDHADSAATTRRRRPTVQIVLTLGELEQRAGRTVEGQPLDSTTIGALLCDAGVHRTITDGRSVILDAGRTTRTVSNHLFAAVAVRDGGCRFPRCNRTVSWCEAHHVVPWQHGGSTEPANLVLLCWRHHHDFAHHPQWHLKLLPDATVEVTRPDGTVMTSRPPPSPPAIVPRS
jgi:hypothetical protein